MGAIDTIRISVAGSGGHGAMPHTCVDAVVAASAIVMNLQTAVSRRLDPVKPTVVSIGTIKGGQADNIIASRVEMTGTVRCLDPEIHQMMPKIIDTHCKNTAAAFGADVVVDYQRMIPPLVNAPSATNRVREACQVILGADSVKEAPISMLGDDFAFFLDEIEGCYFRLGTSSPDGERSPGLHNERFDIDDRSLPIGASILAYVALLSLSAPKKT
jgi:amidohydrolase